VKTKQLISKASDGIARRVTWFLGVLTIAGGLTAAWAGTQNCQHCSYIGTTYSGAGLFRCVLKEEIRECVSPATSDWECFSSEDLSTMEGIMYFWSSIHGEWIYWGDCTHGYFECYTNDTECWRK
jgi:hypothetical protein